ncbi:MAG TPA: chemotaxis protein CheB [Kofleriaceae bacterium]|nr:chemotaxis protein CheB [Kofleriaceae bacterium]
MTDDSMLIQTRDIVAIGCSAGGVEALPRILQQLPGDLEAAVFIVQHMAPSASSHLASILGRASKLPVAWAEQGARTERGRVLISPPDVHMLLSDSHVQLTRGARENHARPSIDKLFRSAAASYGTRVVGVLLTGMLDDGVAGLRTIQSAGGASIVQDPMDAAFPELPGRALQVLTPDRTLPIDAIGGAIAAIVGQYVTASTMQSNLALEAAIDRDGPVLRERLDAIGTQTTMPCPECHGPLWQVGTETDRRYRCYLGHVATAGDLLGRSANEVESALWSAVRALNDRATTLETLASDSRRIGNGLSAEAYASRAREARQQADVARTFMLDLSRSR